MTNNQYTPQTQEEKEIYAFCDTQRNKERLSSTCPWCSESRKKKREKCLKIWRQKNGWYYQCYHATCGKAGFFFDHHNERPAEDWTPPKHQDLPLSEGVLSWLTRERGISKNALEAYGVTEAIEWMPESEKKKRVVCFNYTEFGRHINTKYRPREKEFKMAAGGKLNFYGIDLVRHQKWCVISEGELDALSWYSAGVFFSLSVPNGAIQGKNNLNYIKQEDFENKEKIFLATDNDVAGIMLRDDLARRFGKKRCYIVTFPDDCKDANEVLIKYGKTRLRDCFDQAQPYPVEGVIKVSDGLEETMTLFRDGIPPGDSLGFSNTDLHIQWRRPRFVLWTGIPGHGKSTMIDTFIVRLAQRHGWKFGIFSAEKDHRIHQLQLAQLFLGMPVVTDFQKPDEVEVLRAMEWVNDYFFWLDPERNKLTPDGLLSKGEEMVRAFGIDAFIIDNWSFVELNIPGSLTLDLFYSQCVSKIVNFIRANDCAVWVVVHPRKQQNNTRTPPRGYEAAGSAHFYNKCDVGLTPFKKDNQGNLILDIWKIRFRAFDGKTGQVSFKFLPEIESFLEQEKDLNYDFVGDD